MATNPFDDRWELSDAQREQVRTIKEALAEVEKAKSGLAAIEAALHAQAYLIAQDVMFAMPSTRPSSYQVPIRSMAADLATVTRTPDTSVRMKMDDGATMIQRFPATYSALCESRITASQARVICTEGGRLQDDELRARYEQVVLESTDTTSGRLRPICQAVAEKLQPQTIEERHKTANERRGMWVKPDEDGMALIQMLVDAALAAGIDDRATAIARQVKARAGKGDEDPRTLAQIRADVITDMLLTATPTAAGEGLDDVRAVVHVTVPAEVIAGADDQPAHVPGLGTLAPETARRLAGKAHTWARLFRDPQTGALTAVDTYCPTAEQRRFLTARDEHCRFPGCRRPVRRCDLDHTVPFSEGGATEVSNMAALCRAHHVLKHHGRWGCRNENGVLVWITPTGEVLHEQPPPVVRFVATAAADGDPPF